MIRDLQHFMHEALNGFWRRKDPHFRRQVQLLQVPISHPHPTSHFITKSPLSHEVQLNDSRHYFLLNDQTQFVASQGTPHAIRTAETDSLMPSL